MAGTQVVKPSIAAFPGALIGTWIGSSAVGLELVQIWHAGIAGGSLTHCTKTLSPVVMYLCIFGGAGIVVQWVNLLLSILVSHVGINLSLGCSVLVFLGKQWKMA